MDRIKTMMDQLSDLDDASVDELQASIISEFEAVEKEAISPQTVDAMTSLAAMLDGVRNEIKRREAAAQELAQKAAEAAARVYGQDGDSETNMEAMPAEEKKEEEMPSEEVPPAPVAETPAPADEMPAEEAPAPAMEEEKKPEEMAAPAEKMAEEEEEEKKEEKSMTEASAEADKTAEFSTEEVVPTEASSDV